MPRVIRPLALWATAASTSVWIVAAALAASERRRRIEVAAERPARDGPLVSIVVPARDEEGSIGETVESLLAQTYRNLELVVVDDESEDATTARAAAVIAADPRGRVVAGEAPPEGWLGKPWALVQGVAETSGEWLLFSDADMRHEPTAVGCALAVAQRHELPGLSLLPRLRTGSQAEQVVLPAALTAISTFIAPGPLIRSRRSSVAISVGGWTLIRRGVYDRIGGHGAVRDRVAEDLELARNAKAAGAPIELCDGVPLASLRMYHGLGGLWRGWSKNAAFGVRGGPAPALAAAAVLGVIALAPPLAAIAAGPRRRGLAAIGLVGWLAQAALHLQSRPAVETPAALAPAFPLGMIFLAAVSARAAVRRVIDGGTVWRGRHYTSAR